MMKYISGRTHPGYGNDSMFLRMLASFYASSLQQQSKFIMPCSIFGLEHLYIKLYAYSVYFIIRATRFLATFQRSSMVKFANFSC